MTAEICMKIHGSLPFFFRYNAVEIFVVVEWDVKQSRKHCANCYFWGNDWL